MREIKFRARWRDTGKVIPDFVEEYTIDCLNDDVFIVEQYTGLKDKNGKEIYEGDIVKGSGNPFKIVFQDGCFVGFVSKKRWIDIRIFNDDGTTIWEVVGNQYENPDLARKWKE